ncbi:pseudouridine synthase [Thermodesulfobacteriota bacterium]
MSPTGKQRINKILSQAGIDSRRNADDLIRTGRVKLNNTIVKELGTQAVWGEDSIKVDNSEIPSPSARTYIMLNKPFGYMCTQNDPEGRPIASDLLKDQKQRVYSVGRLDFDSIGLLLFTNDGEFSFRLTHPRYLVPKVYKVTVSGTVNEKALTALKEGVELEDGISKAVNVSLQSQSGNRSVVRLTITYGKNRVVRRMMEALGFNVIQLMRTGFGYLDLGGLKVGQYRYLEPREVKELKKLVGI